MWRVHSSLYLNSLCWLSDEFILRTMEGNKAIPNKKINWCYMLLAHETGKIDYQIIFSFSFSFNFLILYFPCNFCMEITFFFCFHHKCEWTPRRFINAYKYQHYNSIYSSTHSISLKSSVKEVTGSPEALQPCTFPTACGNKFCSF